MKFLYLGEYIVIKILVVTWCMVSSIIIHALYGYSVTSTVIIIVSMCKSCLIGKTWTWILLGSSPSDFRHVPWNWKGNP